MSRATIAPLLVLAAVLGGCASSLSGIGGTEGYACKAPVGAQCTSVSGVYANSTQGVLPIPGLPGRAPPVASLVFRAAPVETPGPAAPVSTTIRSAPRILRLWVAPWEDGDGDLHEEAVIHVVADTGRWLIEHVRPVARSREDGAAPPAAPAQDATPARTNAPGQSVPGPARFPIPRGGTPSGTDSLPTSH